MSGNKRVHFSDVAVINTPSPSWSDASLPSSTGPITPPPRGFELPKGIDYRSDPTLTADHPYLLEYDIALQPHTVSLPLSKGKAKMSDILSYSAAVPPLPYLEFSHSKLPRWRMYIHATDPNTHGLSVADIIKGLYSNFRMSASGVDLAAESKGKQARIVQAMQRRVDNAGKHEDRKKELDKGLKRIDWLEGETLFKGFLPAKDGAGNHWVLVTGYP